MCDIRVGDRVVDGLVGRCDRRCHAGAGGHHPARGDVDTGQVGEDLHDPGNGDVVLRGQVTGQHRDRRPVHRRRRDPRRGCRAGPNAAAGAGQHVQQMRGDPYSHLGHVEDLPDHRIPRHGGRVEAVTAAVTHRREVRHALVRDRHLSQGRTRRPGLLARLAATSGTHRRRRRLTQPIRGRRLGGVRRVQTQPATQLAVLRTQHGVLFPQRRVLHDQPGVARLKVIDPRGKLVKACRQPDNNSGKLLVGRTLTAPARHHTKIIPQWTPPRDRSLTPPNSSDLNSYPGRSCPTGRWNILRTAWRSR
jgi:hypothetical protein